MWKIILIVLALLYALNPFDIVPDFMVGWGWLDDLVVLGLLWRFLYSQKKKREAFQKYYTGRPNSDDNDSANSHFEKESSTYTNSGDFAPAWDPYKVLGVDPTTSPDDIKRAYRHLAGKYHPDKVEHLGEEFKALAEKRFKDVHRAYQELKD